MSKSKITGNVLVIQLGREETQIILMGSGSEVQYGTSVATPAGAVDDGAIRNPDAVRDMLKTALKTPEFKRVRQVVFSLCTSQVIAETVTTPDLPASRLEKLLRANVDMYFPVDIQDYHLVWQVVGPKNNDGGAKELTVQLWAVPIAMVSRYYTVANACGLSVAGIDYCGHSAATAVGASFSHLGKFSKERKKLDLNREISIGGKKKAEPAAPSDEEADEVRSNPDTDLHLLLERGLLGMTFVQNGQVVLQRFVRCGTQPSYQFGELSMMLEYFRSMDIGRGSVIRGIVSGYYAEDKEMVNELEDVLGIPLTTFRAPYELRYFLCVGASRTDLEFGIPSLNIPGKARREVQSQLWQYALILAGGLAVLAVVMFTLSSRIAWDSEISKLESEQQILMAQAAKYNGFADNYDAYKNAYDRYSADWDTVFGSLHATNNNLVRVMEELEAMLPEDSSVLTMQIGATGMNITLACEDKEEAAYIIKEMREMKYIDCNVVFSDLAGGGRGPATSYGSQNSGGENEAPPAEGSSVTITIETVATLTADNIADALSKGGALEKISFDDLALLYSTYGKTPDGNDTYSNVIGENTEELFDERVEAMNKMFDENPFAVQQLIEALSGSRQEIMDKGYGWDMLLLEPNINKLLDFPEDLKGAREYKTKFERVFYQTQDDDGNLIDSAQRLADTEDMLSKDSDLAEAYTYYLAVVMDENAAEEHPYLNVSRIEQDLSAFGELYTGKNSLDTELNKLIYTVPDETKPDETDPTETDPTETTSPDETTQPTTPDREEELKLLLQMYLMTGGTGNEAVDELLQEYVDTGKVDSEDVKDAMESLDVELTDEEIGKIEDAANDFLGELEEEEVEDLTAIAEAAKDFLKEVQDILDKTDPTETTSPTENTDPDATTPSTGETEPGTSDSPTTVTAELLLRWFKTYITEGQVGADQLELGAEKQFLSYFKYGSSVQNDYTSAVDYFVQNGLVDSEMKERIKLYIYHRSESKALENDALSQQYDNGLHGVLTRYFENDGHTGNEVMDLCIKRCLNLIANEVLGDYSGGGAGAGGKEDEKSGGGSSAGYVDTRIKFTAFLTYGDEMMNSELERKGLSFADKIAELFTDLGEGEN